MSCCSLYDAWVDSKILVELAAQNVLAAKEFIMGMRVHKISAQALWRILIPEFMELHNTKGPYMAKSMKEYK